jgi:hypothetical protein
MMTTILILLLSGASSMALLVLRTVSYKLVSEIILNLNTQGPLDNRAEILQHKST